ncbi:MAG: SGNH/GDSL hydrolase family protein [Nitrospirae bacterium]|nr:SGNH/GDSL hydrolase family protein [Nitrospirota bacterium]
MAFRAKLPALAGGSLLVTLGIVEIAFRILGSAVSHRPRIVVGQDGKTADWCCVGELTIEDGLYKFPPRTSFKHCYDSNPNGEFDAENCVPYRINSAGYRDVEYDANKPLDVFRIVLLGDSFTVGEGVPFERIFARRLASALEGKAIRGKNIQVLNMAVSGEDTDGMIALYHRAASRLDPDLVVLQWNTNDFPSSKLAQDHQRLIGIQYRDSFRPPAILAWSMAASFAWRQVRLRSVSSNVVSLTEDELARGGTNFTKVLLLSNLVRSRQQEFAVLVFPELVRLEDYPYANLVGRLNTFLAAEKIPAINLLPDLARHRDRDLWVHETDHHPNGLAHEIASQALLRYLSTRIDP